MNKRIQELAELCYEVKPSMVENSQKIGNDGVPLYREVFNQEKFAELMVVEFTETVKQTANELADAGFRQGQSEEEVMKSVNGALAVLDGIVAKFGVES
jgi:glutathione peroxidase-family protein